jgi:hypothetical protein
MEIGLPLYQALHEVVILAVKVKSLSLRCHSFERRAATVHEHEIYVVPMETPGVRTTRHTHTVNHSPSPI